MPEEPEIPVRYQQFIAYRMPFRGIKRNGERCGLCNNEVFCPYKVMFTSKESMVAHMPAPEETYTYKTWKNPTPFLKEWDHNGANVADPLVITHRIIMCTEIFNTVFDDRYVYDLPGVTEQAFRIQLRARVPSKSARNLIQ